MPAYLRKSTIMKITSCLLFVFLAITSLSNASVIIVGTRVIYPAQQKSINIQLSNNEAEPSLIQSWIDTGDSESAPDSVKVPFIINPPVFRIEPKSGQTLRITYTQEKLPNNKESLFYLNVLDIPAKPKFDKDTKSENNNYLQLAIRSRIKFFFRPSNLKLSPLDAYKKVTWSLEQDSSQTFIKAENNTPYFITYNNIVITLKEKRYSVESPGMVAPFTSIKFPLKNMLFNADKVTWTVINDYGGYQKGESVLK